MQVFLELTEVSLELSRLPAGFHFDTNKLRNTIERRLTNYSLTTASGVLRRSEVAKSYLQSAGSLSSLDTLQGLPSNDQQAIGQLNLILRKSSSGTHPARVLSIVTWLWDDWDSFLNDYRGNAGVIERPAESSASGVERTSADAKRENALIHSIRSGVSISATARSFGIATATVQRVAAKNGIPIARRSKRLKPSAQKYLIDAVSRGQTKHEIAGAIGVEAQTVMRFINTEPGLVVVWKNACAQRIAETKRQAWKIAVDQFGHLGTKHVRKSEPAAYAWLYRNDRDWLVNYNVCKVANGRSNNAYVDWRERDAALSRAVRSVIVEAFSDLPRDKKTLARLCELVPELRAKLAKLDRLPMTQILINKNVAGRFRRNHTNWLNGH